MYLRRFLITALILIMAGSAFAQKRTLTDSDYRQYPHWIAMVDDTTANSFEAEKAFTLFWEKRIMPLEEKDILGVPNEKERKTFLEKLFKSRAEKQREESEKYAFDVKKFRHWQLLMKPYVQDDGRILTPSERLQTWEQHKAIK